MTLTADELILHKICAIYDKHSNMVLDVITFQTKDFLCHLSRATKHYNSKWKGGANIPILGIYMQDGQNRVMFAVGHKKVRKSAPSTRLYV